MGLFDFLRPRTTRGTPALAPVVRACVTSPTPVALDRLYRQLRDSPVLVMLNQRVPGLPNGALLTPQSGVRVEFVTTQERRTGARVVPVFTDEAVLMARFTPHAGARGDALPYVGLRGRHLLAVIGDLGLALYAGDTPLYLDAATVQRLASRRG